jgi:uncharacterized membrane protein
MKRRITTVLGFLIAPLVPVVVGTAISPPSKSADLGIFVVMGAIVYVYSCGLMAFFGVPAYLLLRRKNLVRWWSAMLVGLLVGTLMATVFRLPNQPRIEDLLVMALTGALAGFVFWLIWSRGVDPAARNRVVGPKAQE